MFVRAISLVFPFLPLLQICLNEVFWFVVQIQRLLMRFHFANEESSQLGEVLLQLDGVAELVEDWNVSVNNQ